MTCMACDSRDVKDVRELLPWVAETPIKDLMNAPEEKLLLLRKMKEKDDEPQLDLPEELQGIVKTKSFTALMERIIQ